MRPGDTLRLLAPPWPMLQCSPIQVKVAMGIAQITTTVQLQPSKKVVYYVVCGSYAAQFQCPDSPYMHLCGHSRAI